MSRSRLHGGDNRLLLPEEKECGVSDCEKEVNDGPRTRDSHIEVEPCVGHAKPKHVTSALLARSQNARLPCFGYWLIISAILRCRSSVHTAELIVRGEVWSTPGTAVALVSAAQTNLTTVQEGGSCVLPE